MTPFPRAPYETCAFCPRLCRPVCPIAVGSAREAATPTAMMTGPFLFASGALQAERAAASAALCTSCGACTTFCHAEQPVAALLSAARGALLPPPVVEPPGPVEGAGELVAVECDGRPWGEALARRLGRPVARLVTADHLGEALLDHADAFAAHAATLRAQVSAAELVVADLGCARVAEAANMPFRHILSLAPMDTGGAQVHHPCHGPRLDGDAPPDALACCGAAAPLSLHHPAIAAEVAADAARRLGAAPACTPDARCGAALRAAGADITDPISVLLQGR